MVSSPTSELSGSSGNSGSPGGGVAFVVIMVGTGMSSGRQGSRRTQSQLSQGVGASSYRPRTLSDKWYIEMGGGSAQVKKDSSLEIRVGWRESQGSLIVGRLRVTQCARRCSVLGTHSDGAPVQEQNYSADMHDQARMPCRYDRYVVTTDRGNRC